MVLRDQTLPPEPNPVTSAVWRDRDPDTHKFVDDGIIDSKVNMETVIQDPSTMIRDKHAVASQNTFKRIVRNAEAIGMLVNTDKTAQICISDAQSFNARAHRYIHHGGDKD